MQGELLNGFECCFDYLECRWSPQTNSFILESWFFGILMLLLFITSMFWAIAQITLLQGQVRQISLDTVK